MPKPRALSSLEARGTLVNRLTTRVDRLRQFQTKFGMRSQRCFLVWTKYSGTERGEGREVEVARVEILPTPKVVGLDAVSRSPMAAGILPIGSIRLEEVSMSLGFDLLTGKVPPIAEGAVAIPEPFDFYYELMEDGRGDAQPVRSKFRLSGTPMLREENLDWVVLLTRESLDANRDGTSASGG